MSINSTTGIISGTPKETGDFSVVISAENEFGQDRKTFLIKIEPEGLPPKIKLTTKDGYLPVAEAGVEYHVTLELESGAMPVTWSFISTHPDWLKLSESGVLYGTPPVEKGLYAFSVKVENDYGTDYASYLIEMSEAPLITTKFTDNQLTDASVGTSYQGIQMSAAGTQPILWSAAEMPAGMSINETTGRIEGVPSTAGLKIFSVTATNTYGFDTKIYQINVKVPGGGSEPVLNEYAIINHFGTWTGSGPANARIDADHAKFEKLTYNGEVIDTHNYTITQGSTIITLKESYLNTYKNGTHTFVAHFSDGQSAPITLTVNKSDHSGNPGTGANNNPSVPGTGANNNPSVPGTGANNNPSVPYSGDSSNLAGWWAMLLLSALSILCLAKYSVKSKRRITHRK